MKLGDPTGAEAAFTRALRLNKNLARAALELAFINHDRGDYQQSQQFYDRFRGVVLSGVSGVRQSPRSLMLGIRLARYFGDEDAEASYALVLKNLYPKSREHIEYREATRYE